MFNLDASLIVGFLLGILAADLVALVVLALSWPRRPRVDDQPNTIHPDSPLGKIYQANLNFTETLWRQLAGPPES